MPRQMPRSWSTNIALGISVVALGCAGGIAEVQHHSNSRADNNACVIKTALNKIASRVQELPADKAGGEKAKREAIVFYRDLSNGLQPSLSKCKDHLK